MAGTTFTQSTRPPDKRTAEGDAPSLSIIVPTNQRRELVCEAVLALGEIHYAGQVEIIVVVDGSTDGTAAALRQVRCSRSLRVIEQENLGAAAARNRGAAAATGDILLFLDDDMIADPGLAEEHVRLHRQGADAVVGNTPVHAGSPVGFLPESIDRWIASTKVSAPLSPFDIFTGQLSVRRSVFEELGGFDGNYTSGDAFGHEDSDFGVRLLKRFDVRHNPKAVSQQKYVVTPRQYMERSRQAVAADLRFARTHPQLARDLFERKGISRPLTRCVYLPLSRFPGLAKLVSEAAVGMAEAALQTRFRSSRLVARLFSGARSLDYWAQLRATGWLPVSDRLLTLCYHAIADQSDDPVLARYGVPPTQFADHLVRLEKAGFRFVTPEQVAAFLEADAPLPRNAVLLTFDDGYASLVDIARTVLHPRGIEALVFVVTGTESRTNEWDQAFGAKPVRLLDADGLSALVQLGVEVGSHSKTHPELPRIEPALQANEATASADAIHSQGLPRPRFFAYPFGYSDVTSRAAVQRAGYLAAFGCQADLASRGSDRFDLPRVSIYATDRGWRFMMKVRAPRLFASAERWAARIRKLGRRANAPD